MSDDSSNNEISGAGSPLAAQPGQNNRGGRRRNRALYRLPVVTEDACGVEKAKTKDELEAEAKEEAEAIAKHERDIEESETEAETKARLDAWRERRYADARRNLARLREAEDGIMAGLIAHEHHYRDKLGAAAQRNRRKRLVN